MKIFARSNHIGWIHLWVRKEDFENGEPSDHFFNGRTDPRWREIPLNAGQRQMLSKGELVEIEDPGYLSGE